MNISNEQLNNETILHLTLIPGIGPATIKLIMQGVSIDQIHRIYGFTLSNFSHCRINADKAGKIITGLKDSTLLSKELELIAKHQIKWCVLGSTEYSELLSQIEQPPAVIYYQGTNLFDSDQAIAFVGSRKSDAYARVIIEKLIPPLVQKDWIIVSGGALGVDSLVHDTTVISSGKTIVVLGSGLLHWYPESNHLLFNKVIQSGGMIVSCFSLQSQPIPSNFPARNRIIAGLSQGTVVVQAATKSGALITADFALEQGKQVFAVPGSIEYGLHDGCHNIIQQGAKLVANVDDILQEFEYPRSMEPQQVQQNIASLLSSTSNKTAPDIKIRSKKENNSTQNLSVEDKIILEKLLVATSFDDLLVRVDLSVDDLMQKLFDLSLQGKISQDIMGLWKRI